MRSKGLSALLLSVVMGACSEDGRSPDDAGDASRADGSIADGGHNTVDAGGMDAASGLDAASGADAAGGDGGGQLVPSDSASPFPRNDAGQVLCSGVPCKCSDGIDNDVPSDGLIDTDDPECVSAWDNDETSFATGISGDNRDECQDCFFDGNSGSGDDGCRVPSGCLSTGTPDGQGNCNSCTVSAECKNFCQAYTPNGCDCFGCCTVQLGSNITQNVLLGAGCNIDGSMVTGCTSCVPSVSCVNTCGRCELCPGKTLADLPADCGSVPSPSDGGVDTSDGGVGTPDGGTGMPTPSCDNGEARCGAGLPACGLDEGCSFGCCVKVPVI